MDSQSEIDTSLVWWYLLLASNFKRPYKKAHHLLHKKSKPVRIASCSDQIVGLILTVHQSLGIFG